MAPELIATQSYELLLRILKQAFADASEEDGNLRRAFIYRHAQSILQLSEDVFHLEAEDRCCSSFIVIRVMMESFFNVVAAVKHEKFAMEKLIWEAEDEANRIRKWLDADDATLKETVETLGNTASAIRQEFGITGKLNWNTLACAEAAGLDHHYRFEYFVFSKNVHAATSGMLSSEAGFDRGQVLQTAIYILLGTAGHIVQILPTKAPQRHLNRSTKLMKDLCRAIERKEFEDANSAELQ